MAVRPMTDRLPIGVNLRSIGVEFAWWRDSARRLESAGYEAVYCWDHFVSRGDRTSSVLEAWTTLTAVAAQTERIMLGTFVANVMNRHPAVLARMAATFQEVSGGRLRLGIGIGGHPAEHRAYGIPFPEPAERVERLEEAVTVLRALWTGGPVSLGSRFYPLEEAFAFPRPEPVPRIVIGGETAAGARLAGRIGDGWTTFVDTFERDEPIYREALAESGRARADQLVLVGYQYGKGGSLAGSAWVNEPRAELERWRALGADGAVVMARTTADVDALVEATARW
jgi:alkanesulfonate monooxygenase SsuD/methylene tetrahydromethanopterin reductase-like flavin-dependent oxidoreductase (luciferase family)